MNDMMNETRRVYIGKEHVNIEQKHSPLGDSIGFWDGDKLIIWTKWVNPADYVRGMPLTSNQFEMVETWQARQNGDRRELVTQVDVLRSARADGAAVGGLRARVAARSRGGRRAHPHVGVHESSSNSYKDAEGNTQFYLPGDPQYKDPRGSTDFPDLPGQSLNPLFDAEAQSDEARKFSPPPRRRSTATGVVRAPRNAHHSFAMLQLAAAHAHRGRGRGVELQQSAQLAASSTRRARTVRRRRGASKAPRSCTRRAKA